MYKGATVILAVPEGQGKPRPSPAQPTKPTCKLLTPNLLRMYLGRLEANPSLEPSNIVSTYILTQTLSCQFCVYLTTWNSVST